MTDVDILVHTSAPSRGPDDARYRALAHAYLHFVPATRQRLEIEDKTLPDELDEQVNSQLHEELRNSTQKGPESWESYQPDDEEDDHDIEESQLFPTQTTQPESHDRVANLILLDSPQLSFNSVGNNADSPEFRGHVTCDPNRGTIAEETQKSTDSWQMPPSTIADSQPEHNKTIGALASPTRMLELYLQQIESSDQESQESEAHRRQQSISETPARTFRGQLSRTSNVRDFGYDGALENPDLSLPPSIVKDTPARPVASPILGNPTSSTASSPEVYSSSRAPISRMLPPQISCMANSRLGVSPTHQKTNVVSPSVTSPDSNNLTHESPSTRRQSFARESVRTMKVPRQIPDHLQASSSLLSTSSFGVQVPKTSALGISSPTVPSLRTPNARIPETPYHVTASTQYPAMGEKRGYPGESSGKDQVLGSAPADIGVVSTSVEFGKVPPQAKRRRIEEVSIDWIPSSVPDIPLTKDFSQQLVGKPEQSSKAEGIASEFSSKSDPSVSNSIRETSSPTRSPLISYSSHTTITPSPPKTSNASLDPMSFITPCLISLSKKLPLSRLYHPTQQFRPLRPTERGYWLINCKPWPESLRKRCWDCLGNFIEKGKAGWGVRCERHEDWQWIRIYCWGVVVDYIYLLLFMGSENKIKKVDCVWIGGDGNALITMPKVA